MCIKIHIVECWVHPLGSMNVFSIRSNFWEILFWIWKCCHQTLPSPFIPNLNNPKPPLALCTGRLTKLGGRKLEHYFMKIICTEHTGSLLTEIEQRTFSSSALRNLIVNSLFSMSQNSIAAFRFSTGSIFCNVCHLQHWVYRISLSSLHQRAVTVEADEDKSEPLQLPGSPCECLQMNSSLGRSQAAQNHLGIHPVTQSIISTACLTIRNRYPFATSTARCTNREVSQKP